MIMLKRGDVAPLFTGVNQFGELLSSNDFKGKKLIVFFYPKDNTPACNAEVRSLKEAYWLFEKHGFAIVGINRDSIMSHKKFSDKFLLPFSLISDTDMKIIDAFGVWGEKRQCNKNVNTILRTTFIISEKGIIEHVITKVSSKDHATQILELYL